MCTDLTGNFCLAEGEAVHIKARILWATPCGSQSSRENMGEPDHQSNKWNKIVSEKEQQNFGMY